MASKVDQSTPTGQREEAERAEYEAWAKDQGWETEMYNRTFYTGLTRDTYKDSRTDDGWYVWLAGRAALRASHDNQFMLRCVTCNCPKDGDKVCAFNCVCHDQEKFDVMRDEPQAIPNEKPQSGFDWNCGLHLHSGYSECWTCIMKQRESFALRASGKEGA